MARWTDIAEWRGPTINEGDGDGRPGEPEDRAVECRGAVLHIADGYYEGTISWQHNAAADVSSHFVVAGPRDVPRGRPDGRIGQVVDTDIRAWTQRDGNGHWLSIECSGFSGDSLSAAQIEACARILAKGHQVYGYPLQIATSPAGRGLGHHSMGTNGQSVPTDTWTGPTWGHEQCPGPAIIAQKPAILARAIQLADGVTSPQQPPQEDDMFLANVLVGAAGPAQKNFNYLGTVGAWHYIPTKEALAWVKAQGFARELGSMWDSEARDRLGIDLGAPAPVVDPAALAAAVAAAVLAKLPADTLSRAEVEAAVHHAIAGATVTATITAS